MIKYLPKEDEFIDTEQTICSTCNRKLEMINKKLRCPYHGVRRLDKTTLIKQLQAELKDLREVQQADYDHAVRNCELANKLQAEIEELKEQILAVTRLQGHYEKIGFADAAEAIKQALKETK